MFSGQGFYGGTATHALLAKRAISSCAHRRSGFVLLHDPTQIADLMPPKNPGSWIDAIKNSPHKYPYLNRLLFIGDMYENRGEKTKHHISFLKKMAPWFLGPIAASFFLTGKMATFTKPISRRRFGGAVAASVGLVAAGRAADNFSTRKFLNDFAHGLEGVQANRHFQALPQDVRKRLIPPVSAMEGNPYQDRGIERIRSARAAARDTITETASAAAITGAPLALTYLIRRKRNGTGRERRPISRRAFFALSAGIGISSLKVGLANVLETRDLKAKMPEQVGAELELLHTEMKGRME